MKSQFLKIAGVKSEKAFYKKFPTEAAFFKAHPEAKKMVNGGEQDRGQLKKLKQLTDFGNPPIAQTGEIIPFAKSIGGKDIVSTLGGLSKGPSALKAVDLTKGASKGLGPATSYIGAATDIIGGIGTLKKEKQQLKELERDSKLSGLMLQASQTRPEAIKRQYVRPEDVVVQPGQLASAYGTGTNILAAEDGATIGGNPTEIMNTFAPNTIYTDMGYEPLDDSSKVKQYYAGGKLTKAQLGGEWASKLADSGIGRFASDPQGGQFMTNIATKVGGGPSGSSQLGKGIGTAAGTAFLGPVGGIIGGALGSLVGGLFGKKRKKKMANYQKSIDQNVFGMTGQDFSQGIQGEFGGFMKNGGETSDYAWVSHTWQPQVITKFGDYSVDQLLAPDKTMDTLRTGGHIRQNNTFATDMFAMGGDLKVYRGEAEPVSTNPYLPDGGETVMFRGPSHADGGMPIEYGKSPVEVEGGEPAVKLKNGSTGDEDLVVFGNLIEPQSKRKFKNVVADIAKKENRENNRLDKSVNMLDNLDVDTSFDKLTLDSLKANIMGANMKLKNYADEKMDLAAKQSAINETAEEYGIDADALAKGKMKKAKLGAAIKKAQTGVKQDTGVKQEGSTFTYNGRTLDPNNPEDAIIIQQFRTDEARFNKDIEAFRTNAKGDYSKAIGMDEVVVSAPNYLTFEEWLQEYSPEDLIPGVNEQELFKQYQMHRYKYGVSDFTPINTPDVTETATVTEPKTESKDKQKFPWTDIANQIIPQLRPTDSRRLSGNQILGEITALADNVEQPVYAQKFTPRLLSLQKVSLQDRIDDVDKQARSAMLAAGDNQAAQSVIMTQAIEAKDRIRSEEFRLNQANFLQNQATNVDILNRADLQNLQTFDLQQERQARAKSMTKATKQAALQSIGNKYAQNKLEQQQIQAYENLYNFRSGPGGRMQNLNPLAQFNIPNVAGQAPIYDKDGNVVGFQQMTSDLNASQAAKATRGVKSRNGSIVKAIKNL